MTCHDEAALLFILDELAYYIAKISSDDLSSRTIEQVKLHIFDSMGALFAGACSEEAGAICDLVRKLGLASETSKVPVIGFDFSAPLPHAVLVSCATTRMTETDDIDLMSCTTPGSVVVPSALLLSYQVRASFEDLLEGIIAGYEVMTRLGAAGKGTEIIYRGIWPTYLWASVSAATVGSKMLDLNEEQIKNALAISLTLSTGISGRTNLGLTSRWLTLGCAVQNGLIAALSAEKGFLGDRSILDTIYPSAYDLKLDTDVLLKDIGEQFKIEKVGLKPYCCARQTLASIEAYRFLLDNNQFDPEKIENIEVLVPRQYVKMIDHGSLPEGRLSSIVSIQYQLALASFYEEDLFDVQRKVIRDEEKIIAFMQKIHVKPSPRFTEMYPLRWPGKVIVKASGQEYEHEVLAPKGDPDQPLTWEDVARKIERLTCRFFEPAEMEALGAAIKALDGTTNLEAFFNALPKRCM